MPPESSSPRHEITPWRARPFLIGAISFFAFMDLVFVIVGGLTATWTHHTWPLHAPVRDPESDPNWNRVTPQLQVHAAVDLRRLRQTEYQNLHAVKWTDETHTFASIPIEQAMALLAQAQTAAQLNQLLPPPKPATPIELQDQKSKKTSSQSQ